MLRSWTDVTEGDGGAAYTTARLAASLPIIDGAVLGADTVRAILEGRREQVDALLDALDGENTERVAAELRDVILTVHVPREVQQDVDATLDRLATPILARLSPCGRVADPLAPTMLIGLSERKLTLDAIRMLCAECYSASNLEVETDTRDAAIIVQSMPACDATYRIIHSGAFTIVEGTRGLGAWVGHGEPDRFLFENSAFAHAEHGDGKGVRWVDGAPQEFVRTPLGGTDAERVLAAVKPYLDALGDASTYPLLVCEGADGVRVLGARGAIPKTPSKD